MKIKKPFSIEAWKSGAKVETEDGLPVRILCTDVRASDFDVVGLVEQSGAEKLMQWYASGETSHDLPDYDLVIIEEVEEPERWAEDMDKCVILRQNGKPILLPISCTFFFLTFHTKKQAELFLTENEQLVKDYLMIN